MYIPVNKGKLFAQILIKNIVKDLQQKNMLSREWHYLKLILIYIYFYGDLIRAWLPTRLFVNEDVYPIHTHLVPNERFKTNIKKKDKKLNAKSTQMNLLLYFPTI